MYRATRNTTRALAGLAITGVLGLGGVGLANAATDDEVVPTLTAVDDSTADTTSDTTGDLPTLDGDGTAPADRGGRGPGGGRRGAGGCDDGATAPADDATGTPADAPAEAPVTVEEEAPATVAPQPEQSVDTGDL